MMRRLVPFLVLVLVLTIAPDDALASGPGADATPAWGTQDNIVMTIAASGFQPRSSSESWSTDSYRYAYTSTASFMTSPLSLPAGAQITALELQACDETSAEGVYVQLTICPHRGLHTCTIAESVGTDDLSTPGCDGFFGDVDPPVVVDNLVNTYMLEVWMGDSGNETRFLSVLVSYRLQVSPAPATATFNDVSTGYWAFQHIEALAKSGITAGCGGGSFCPNNNLTRAEMAVFLAKALGLHWPY